MIFVSILLLIIALSSVKCAMTLGFPQANETVLYVEKTGVQYTDKDSTPIYDIRPLPKVPILISAFDIYDGDSRKLCEVRQKLLRVPLQFSYTCSQPESSYSGTIVFPLVRYHVKITVNGVLSEFKAISLASNSMSSVLTIERLMSMSFLGRN